MVNSEDWHEGWEYSVTLAIAEMRKFSSAELLEKIKVGNDPSEIVNVAMWMVIEERKERNIGFQIVELLQGVAIPSDFMKRERCVSAIFKIFEIENLSLHTLITGPSNNDFNMSYFKLGIRRLKEIIGE